MSFEDRLSKLQLDAVDAALLRFDRKRVKDRHAEHVCYDTLTNAGCTPEEADELINLYMEVEV